MSQAVSAVAAKSNPPVSLVSFNAPSALAAPTAAKQLAVPPAAAAKPATITSIGQSTQPSLGLFNNAGVVAKPAVTTAPTAAPAGGATFVAGKDDVTVEIQKSDSGFDNKIYYSTDNFATKHLIGIDNQTGTVNLGKFAEGTKIEFGIQNGANQFFRTGAAATNFDNFQHALTSKNGDGTQIGFEDLAGGGDKDFNDAIITVRSVPAKVVATPAPSAKDVTPKDNRSGLGDGTNPGQGAGRENSPNQGTSNPNNAAPVTTAPVKPPVATAPLDVAKPAPPVVATPPAPVAVKPPVATAPPAKIIPPLIAPVIQAKPEPLKVSKPELENDAKPAPTRESEAEKSSKAAQKAAETAGAVQTAIEEALKTNRSGLGDGSNPGQGTGKANSPNRGTANPGGAILAAIPKPAAPAKPVAVAAAPVTIPSPAPKASTEAAKPEAAAKDNRSGLGDGTNPGQGAGRTNSPNQGTSNPNNANTTIKPGLKV